VQCRKEPHERYRQWFAVVDFDAAWKKTSHPTHDVRYKRGSAWRPGSALDLCASQRCSGALARWKCRNLSASPENAMRRSFSAADMREVGGSFGLRPAPMNFRPFSEGRDHPVNCWDMYSDLRLGFDSKISLAPNNGSYSFFTALLTYSFVYWRHVI
jgi:hypothetical protein